MGVEVVMFVCAAVAQLPPLTFSSGQTLAGPLVADPPQCAAGVAAQEVPVSRDAGVAAPAAHVLVAVALAAGLLAVHVAVVDAVRVAVAALAADERVVAVGLGLAAVALVALHT